MIDLSKYQILRSHMCTLKETSSDTKDDGTKIYMVESTRQAVNFDDVKDEYIKDLKINEKVNAGNPDVIREQKRHVQPSVSFDYIAKEIGRYAKDEYVCFGINIFENYCFRKVHTYTEQEFEKYVQNL